MVVGRELSVEEIASVGKGSNVEIEAFVHGALCVSYRSDEATFVWIKIEIIYGGAIHQISMRGEELI